MRASQLVSETFEVARMEARIMIEQGAIWVDGERITDPDQTVKNTAEVKLWRQTYGAPDFEMY